MDHLHRVAILLMVAGMPAAAPPVSSSDSDLCLAAGSLTYLVSRSASVADLRVKIDPQASNPDLRARLVDDVASADFALVDDTSTTPAAACARSEFNKIVRITTDSGADLTVALSSEPADAPLR